MAHQCLHRARLSIVCGSASPKTFYQLLICLKRFGVEKLPKNLLNMWIFSGNKIMGFQKYLF